MTLIFDPSRSSKIKGDGASWKPVVPTCKCSRGVQPRICHRFRDISSQNFDCSPFDLGRANPWAKCHRKERWPTIHLDLPSYKILARSRKRSTRYALPNFFTFWLRGANPWAKVHQRGVDLADSEIYHPAKLHHSMPTHARDIRYQNPGDKKQQTKKQ